MTGAGGFVAEGRTIWANDDPAAATPTLTGALQLANVRHQSAVRTEYAQIVPTPRSPHFGQQRITMRNVLVDQSNEEAGASLAEALAHPAVILGEIRALGGAVADIDSDATAWAGRHQEALLGIWAQPRPQDVIDTAFGALQSLGTGMYGAYSSDTRSSAAELAWPGSTGERLRAAAIKTDPEALFNRGLSVRGG